MRQLFKFSLVSLALILALALCSNIFAQSSLIDFGPSNGSGTHKIEAPLAPVVFLNQAPNTVNGLFADATCALCGTGQQTIADNFTATIVNATTGITELVIWGGYYPEDIPNTTDNFTIIVHSDAAGQPGAVIANLTGLQATNRVNTGVVLFGCHEYKFTFDFSANPIMVPSTGTYWIELFNNSTQSGNFFWETGNLDGTHGIMGSAWYTTTPGTAWNLDGSTDLSAQVNGDDNLVPCPVGQATNPNPPSGTVNVPINLPQISWVNGAGATSIEVFFNGSSVYSGSPITSWALPVLNYYTTYSWKVNESDASCTTNGPTWTFQTMQNPLLVIDTVDVYPQSSNYWTGTTTATAKTQVSLMNIMAAGEQAWAKFDVSSIQAGATITSVSVNWYINTQNCPYFYINALPIDPVTANAATLYAAITGGVNYYLYQTCPVAGWNSVLLAGNANADLAASIPSGWFALSFYEYESSTYYFTAQGWAEANKPYLHVIYEYIVPVELTSFTATANDGDIELSWITATETNNQGFEVQKSNGSEFETIAFVEGHGTTTEPQAYSYSDRSVNDGNYSYRLKQIDFNGTFEYSNVVEVDVSSPAVYALEQNYPNPFNPSTKIAFRLAVDSKVSLKVFDILGQEVATLVNTNLVAGSHNINFDASSLNSGVYFYRIEATGIDGTNFVDVKKMILTK